MNKYFIDIDYNIDEAQQKKNGCIVIKYCRLLFFQSIQIIYTFFKLFFLQKYLQCVINSNKFNNIK